MARKPKPYQHKIPKPKAVREPIQVYLDQPDRALLDRVAAEVGLSRAEVLRRGIRTFAVQQQRGEGPMMRMIRDLQAAPWPEDTPADLAQNHDKYLAALYLDTHEPRESPRLR